MNHKMKQKLLERKFDQQLKSAIAQLTYEASRRVLSEKEGEEDDLDTMLDDLEGGKEGGEEDKEGGKEGGEEDKEEDEGGEKKKKGGRGGPQVAKAAYRDEPPPEADDLDIDMLSKKLNAIRSGKSLNDDKTRARTEEYFASLSKNQRLALYAFLEGLAEVIAAEVDGDEARAPDDPEYRVDIKVKQGEQDVEQSIVKPIEKRVVKPGATEYDQASGRRSLSQTRRRGTAVSSPDDSPVTVVK